MLRLNGFSCIPILIALAQWDFCRVFLVRYQFSWYPHNWYLSLESTNSEVKVTTLLLLILYQKKKKCKFPLSQLATLPISEFFSYSHLLSNYGVTYASFNRFWVSIAKDFLTITYFWRFSILIVLKTELLSSRTNFMMLFKIMFLISSINLDVCSNFRSHSDGVTCLQFNDFYIVSGSYDKTVKLWDFTVC